MKKRFALASTLAFAAATSLGAQGLSSPVCTTSGSAQSNALQDACQQTYDLFTFLAPQLGISLAGGNATLGTGSTLGGIGHFSRSEEHTSESSHLRLSRMPSSA